MVPSFTQGHLHAFPKQELNNGPQRRWLPISFRKKRSHSAWGRLEPERFERLLSAPWNDSIPGSGQRTTLWTIHERRRPTLQLFISRLSSEYQKILVDENDPDVLKVKLPYPEMDLYSEELLARVLCNVLNVMPAKAEIEVL
jgi:hypothetical protein